MMRMALIVRMRDLFTGPAGRIMQTIRNMGDAAEESSGMIQLGANLSIVGGRMSEMGTQGREAISGLIAPFTDLEEAVAKAGSALAPASGNLADLPAVMEAAEGAARRWGNTTSQTAEDFLEATYILAGAGLTAEQAIAGTEAAMKVARATFGTGEEAGDLLSTMYNNMGNKARDAGEELMRLGDKVTQTQNKFQIANFSTLQGGLKYALNAGQQYQVQLEQILASVGQLNSAGLQGEMAGTSFGSMLSNLHKAAKEVGFGVVNAADGSLDLIATLENVRAWFGTSWDVKTTARFKDAFGEEGLRAFVALIKNVDNLKGAFRSLDDQAAAGTTDRIFKKLESTTASQMQQVKNQLVDATRDLGATLIPILRDDVLPMVKDFAGWLRDVAREYPGLVKIAAVFLVIGTAVGSIGGPILSVIASLITMLAMLRTAQTLSTGLAAANAAGAAGAAGAGGGGVASAGAGAAAGTGLATAIPVVAGAYVAAKSFEAVAEGVGPQDAPSADLAHVTQGGHAPMGDSSSWWQRRLWYADDTAGMYSRQSRGLVADVVGVLNARPRRPETTRDVAQRYVDARSDGANARAYSELVDRGVSHEQLTALTTAMRQRDAVNWWDRAGRTAANERIDQVLEQLSNAQKPEPRQLQLPAPGQATEKSETKAKAPDAGLLPGLYRALAADKKEGTTIHIGNVVLNEVADADDLLAQLRQKSRESDS